MIFEHAGKTDVGRVRARNEDNLAMIPELGLFVVADGMGGHKGGEHASRFACLVMEDAVRGAHAVVDGFVREPTPARRREVLHMLDEAVRSANERIVVESELHSDLAGMGTTLVALLLAGDHAFVAYVGDSRLYLVRGSTVSLVTDDHSLFFELIRQGRIGRTAGAKFPYKNVVTRALCMQGGVVPDVFDFEILPGDRLLLCTDGMHMYLEDHQILGLASTGPTRQVVDALVAYALASGGADNVTGIVVDVRGIDGTPEDVAERLKVVASFPILQGLSMTERIRLVSACEHRLYHDGAILFTEGENSDGLYGVLSGHVEVRRAGRSVASFGAGRHFGEMSMVEERPRLVTGIARGEVGILVLSRYTFANLLKHQPSLSAKLLRNLVLILSQRLRSTNDELVILRTNYEEQRLEIPALLPSDMLEEE